MIATLAAVAALAQGAPFQIGKGLDCSLGYEGLIEQVEGQRGVERQSNPPSVPYVTYSDPATKSLYSFTVEGAVGHPGAVKRAVVTKPDGVYVTTSACGYGTRGAFDRMMAQFRDLNGKARSDVLAKSAK